MKQDIAIYKVDSFIDFTGKEHKFVACALSQSPVDKYDRYSISWIGSDNYAYDDTIKDVYRMVTIGIAICNPEDEFDLEKGKTIARNKANNGNLPRIYATTKGIITQELVETFLNQQIKFFKENPENFIGGYKEAKIKHETLEQAKSDISNLDEDEKKVFDLATKGFDFSKYVKLAKVYLTKLAKNE